MLVCVWERERERVCVCRQLATKCTTFTTYNNQRADIFWELSTGDVLRAPRLSRTAQRTGHWKLPKPLGRHRQVCVPQKIHLSPRGGTHLYSVYPRYCERLLWAVAAPAGCASHQSLHCQIDTTLVPNPSTLNPKPSTPHPKLQTLIPNPSTLPLHLKPSAGLLPHALRLHHHTVKPTRHWYLNPKPQSSKPKPPNSKPLGCSSPGRAAPPPWHCRINTTLIIQPHSLKLNPKA